MAEISIFQNYVKIPNDIDEVTWLRWNHNNKFMFLTPF